MAWALCAAALLLIGVVSPAPAAGAYPGEIALHVDATDVQRRIYRVTETIPVQSGRLVLHYPQWLPGNHAPRGLIEQLAGLTFRAGDRELAWKRDPLNVYAFEVQVPDGVSRLEAEFQVLTAAGHGDLAGRKGRDDRQPAWAAVEPGGAVSGGLRARAISRFVRSVQLPADWKYASALPPAPSSSPGVPGRFEFAPVPLETLVDSPLYAGRTPARSTSRRQAAGPCG